MIPVGPAMLDARAGAQARRGRWRPNHDDDGERGQIMILSLGFALVAIALVLVVASASAVHIERKQLLALADAAALDAADTLDLDTFYGRSGGVSTAGPTDDAPWADQRAIPLTSAGIRDAVAAHLAAAPSARGLESLAVAEPTGTPDGTTAQVTLTALARPPFVPWALVGWADGIALRVTTTARADPLG